MAASDVLETMASYAHPPAFPWADLEAQGKGLIQSDAYLAVLEAKFNQYFQVVWRLDIPELQLGGLSSSEARAAYEDLSNRLASRAGVFIDAISRGSPTVALDEALKVPSDLLAAVLVALSAVAYSDYQGHDSGAWRWMVTHGRTSVEEAKSSAEDIYRLWDAVIQLDNAGLLESLKKPEFKKPTSGLGAVQIPIGIAIVIAVAVVVVIAILSWVIVTLKVESNRVEMIEKSCFDPDTGKPLSPAPPHCAKYWNNIAEDPNAHLNTFLAPLNKFSEQMGEAVKKLFTIAGWGVLLYVGGVYVLPAVLETFGKRASKREPKALPEPAT